MRNAPSQYEPYGYDDSQPPQWRPRPPKPGSLTVFAILNIVFGGMGLIGAPIGILMVYLFPEMPGVMREGPIFVWMIISSVVGFFLAGILIAAGIGLLSGRKWARILSIIYALAAIAMGILGTIINVMFFLPAVQGQGGFSGAVGGAIGGLIGLAYPVLLLFFMNKEDVKEYCEY